MHKVPRYLMTVLALILVAAVAAACDGGGGGTSNTPEDAAKGFLEAAFAGNIDGVRANLCESEQANAEGNASAFASMGTNDTTFDLSGVTYTKASESGDTAAVNIGGTATVTSQGVSADVPMQEFPQIPLRRENNAWKVCGLSG